MIQAMIKFLSRIWRGIIGKFVCIILCLWIFVAAFSFVWTPYSLLETNGYQVWQKPSLKHWLGTDGTGADMLSWLMAGSRVEILLVISTIVIASVVGFVILSFTICRVQKIRSVIIMAVDALISIPTVLIALMLAVPLGTSVLVIMLACGFGYGLNLARILRPSSVLVLKSDYVDCAISNGASRSYVLLKHVLPNILPIASVQLSLSAGTVILAESGLTYLGVGVPSGVPSWGRVLSTSVTLIHVYPLAALWPGLVVTLTVLALNLFGDVLRSVTNPANRESKNES